MNTNSELERIIHDWLETRVVDPPHGSMDSALSTAGSTPQQRHRWLGWWYDRGRGATAKAPVHGPDERTQDSSFRLIFSATVVATGVAAVALVATIGTRLDTTQSIMPAVSTTTHMVNAEGGAFATIGAAVEAAAEGDTILVGPGVYEEALIIDKDITLKGDAEPPREVVLLMPEDAPDPVRPLAPFDRTADGFTLPERIPVGIQLVDTEATVQDLVVIGQGDGIAMLVLGGAPSLEGVALKHEGTPLPQLSLAGGLFIEGGSTADVRDSVVQYRARISGDSMPVLTGDTFSYLLIQDGAAPTLHDNTMTGGRDCGAVVVVVGGAQASLTGNAFVDSGLHIAGRDDDGTSAALEGNRFSGSSGQGVLVSDTATATITGNAFSGNQQGVRVAEATAEVRDNEFVGVWNSVMFRDTDSTLAGNTIRGGTIGATFSGSGSPLVQGNLIENAAMRGILVAHGASPIIEGNTICGSSENLFLAEGAEPTMGENDICADIAPDAD